MNGTISCNPTTTTTKTTTSTTTTPSTTITTSTTRSTTTKTTTATTATSKTSPTPQTPAPPTIHQTPGKCKKKDITPVELDETWQDSCKDDNSNSQTNKSKYQYLIIKHAGNSYSEGSSLMSCCGCFRYSLFAQFPVVWISSLLINVFVPLDMTALCPKSIPFPGSSTGPKNCPQPVARPAMGRLCQMELLQE